LHFNGSGIQIANTNGTNDPRTVIMFTKHTTTNEGALLFGFEWYTDQALGHFMFSTGVPQYGITDIIPTNNTWYHIGAVMTGTGNMVGNKQYVNGKSYPLSWIRSSPDGNAIFQNYIIIGGVLKNAKYDLYGYESHIYYFDREL